MAEFSPISENFTLSGPIEEVDWDAALTTPAAGYVDTDVSESFQPDRSNDPYTFPSVRGSAISVQDKLANISFVEGSASEMSASIAYIRYWSRRGTQQKTVVGSAATDNVVSDPQEALLGQINSLSYGTGLDFSSIIAPVSETTPPRTVLTTPTNTAYQSRPRQPVTTTTTGPSPTSPNLLGSIYSANPGGTAAPAWANPFYTPAAAPDPDGAVWQFLFNPEELQLSSGPDYNRAETWGVADPANSGQPLSWRSNKNRKLTFGKVLLHGYTFGKRVDSLENGLQQLFQARDGENGADGPPVLEFVWGQRVFGPCVIQNIQVREKAWDKGLLVNAEVSFDLEQVPEWTINDGFVDVLRPGRQSTINDPSLPGRTDSGATAGGETPPPEQEPPANKPGGGGGDEKPQNADLCNKMIIISSNFKKLSSDSGDYIRNTTILGSIPFGPPDKKAREFLLKLNLNKGSIPPSVYKNIRKEILKVAPGCVRSYLLFEVVGDPPDYPRAIRFANGCSVRFEEALNKWLNKEGSGEGKCVQLRKARQAKESKQRDLNKCKTYRNKETCSKNQAGSGVTCDGISYYCRRVPNTNSYKWSPL